MSKKYKSQLPNPPSLVTHESASFLIMDTPSESNVNVYIDELRHYNVKVVVRLCEPTYNLKTLEDAGFTTYDWPFPDGDAPPDNIISQWVKVIKEREGVGHPIAVHCVAGLGRAPVLVVVGLIELGMEWSEAVTLVRQHRRGALNSIQLNYLENYHTGGGGCCTIL